MTEIFRVIPDELRTAGAGWNAQVFELHAAPPQLELPSPWPTMLASAAVTGAAQAATADLHTRISTTAGATQVAATGYDANEADAVGVIKNVIATIPDAIREST
ncbi:MAG: hypothetical protein QJR12_09895 [Mycobacterium sp.]|uniref:hypothetical protein n=1 Tax=Mycobacterium sp. TaxID=1785 RepID=UPI00261FA95A|nr:hypothetical protein [Mycobacterium sp.]MDI3314559.1 hypothetical protein [Mycobacterium sp.]